MVPFYFNFIQNLIENRVQEKRYTAEMQELFTSHNLKWELWNTETSFILEELYQKYPDSRPVVQTFDVKRNLLESFEHNHLNDDYKAVYDYINNHGPAPKLEDNSLFNKYKNGIPEEQRLLAMHRLSLLWEEPHRTTSLLNQLKQLRCLPTEFVEDINRWQKIIESEKNNKKLNYEAYKITRSNRPDILFQIGAKAGGSCQRTNGDPINNKCLLSYPCDGKNQVIFAESPDGKIVTRAILRFFYTLTPDEKNPPVFYLEPFYSETGGDDGLRQGITLAAIECAKSLNIPLVRKYKREEKQPTDIEYPFDLKTINGPAPFEYYDGAHSRKIKENRYVSTDGMITTSDTLWIQKGEIKQIWSPS